MSQLHGYDVSDFQPTSTLATASMCDFALVKATEGTGFVAKSHAAHIAAGRKRGILLGHYHFAHANGDATAQADFFLTNAGALPGEVLVLDFEPYGQPVSPAQYGPWIVKFADRIKAKTGIDPWLYIDDGMIRTLAGATPATTMARIRQMPLWKADYGTTYGQLEGWPAVTAWQYTDKPLDQDHFYGDANTWRALAIPSPLAQIPNGQMTHLAAVLKAPAGQVIQGLQAHLNTVDKLTPALTVDGVAGRLTVTALQNHLNKLGAHLTADGVFGPLTSAALDKQLAAGTI